MATKIASPHTAGIFADMTLDGPEIGTLVVIVDRAKNLPNRKSMGKQSAYCAARLGKEAKKTETDKRGGQTPKWDQELRFTVHDSPDYFTMKVSVFSEDKRTDLIGEAWVSLKEVIIAGGGKNDLWQGLNCKGKYAGEIRIELTYYDSRPKPERPRAQSVVGEEEVSLRQSVGGPRVKRRPLPTNPNHGATTPDSIPDVGIAAPGRARYGPRDFTTPPRGNSMPPELVPQPLQPQPLYASSPQEPLQQTPPHHFYEDPQQHYDEPQQFDDPYQQPDFLPQLPPSNRQRTAGHQRLGSRQAQAAPMPPRPFSHIGLPHSHSAPVVPQEPQAYDNGYGLSTDYPEPIPDIDYQHQHLRQRRNDAPPGWSQDYADPYAQQAEDATGPPPPPMHSNSAPVVPHFSHSQQPSPTSAHASTPPGARHHSVPNTSPLQSIERRYGQPQQTPPHARGRSMDDYGSSPEHTPYGSTPPSLIPGQTPSPYARSVASRGLPARHSVADPYGNTPPRPHPLSQEVPRPRSRSPLPYAGARAASPLPHEQPEQYQHEYHGRDAPPLIKPRALSPRPTPPQQQPDRRSRSAYSLQYPARAFESSDGSPLSTSRPPISSAASHTPTLRKNVSPRPSPTDDRPSSAGVPFSPDSFDIHNPNAPRNSPLGTSPHAPYQSRAGSEPPLDDKGPIVGWHGNEIDPSDHLPVDSWAPEPKKKTPTKTYGLGRDRDFGPRSAQGTPNSGNRLGKDTVISIRTKGGSASEAQTPSPTSSGGRNRLRKSQAGGRSPSVEPLGEHMNYNSVPDPYAGQAEYSRSFMEGRPAYGAPNVPPKVPLQQEYGHDALAREISSIDIGSGRHSRPANGGVPPPTAYVPVRSHRDRQNYY